MNDLIYTGYRLLWIQVLFDLPVMTKKDRKEATEFRRRLLDEGFEMAQFSVYQRFSAGREKANAIIKKVISSLPNSGLVHILIFTDKQYESMMTFSGKKRNKKLHNPDQLALF